MKPIIQTISASISAFTLILILIPMLKKIANKYNLVDKPNARKIHQTPVPIIGGISIALVISLITLINSQMYQAILDLKTIFPSAILLLVVGCIDDKVDLKAKYKLIIQLCCALAVSISGIRIMSLYGLFGVYEIPLLLQHTLTVIIVTGVLNAMNLMDGIDGLLGEIAILGFLVLIAFSIYLKEYALVTLFTAFIAAIIGFLKFNFSSKKIFMGDAGSLFLSNVIISSAIYLINKEGHTETSKNIMLVSVIALFSIPVMDSLRVYLGRMKYGNSPFKADKTHFHHLLLQMNFSHKGIGIIVILLSITFFLFGLISLNYINLLSIILILVTVFSIISFLLNLNKKVNTWITTIKELEHKNS